MKKKRFLLIFLVISLMLLIEVSGKKKSRKQSQLQADAPKRDGIQNQDPNLEYHYSEEFYDDKDGKEEKEVDYEENGG